MPATEKKRVTLTAYNLAMQLFAANADKKAIPVTQEMIESKLGELTGKNGIAVRQGFVPGPSGKSGTVKLLVVKGELEAKPTRVRQIDRTGNGQHAGNNRTSGSSALTTRVHGSLSIAAVEEFARSYRREEQPIRAERSKAVEERITELQKYLAISTGDDFRNTMTMANAALRNLDEIDHQVTMEVLARINPGPNSPLYVIWRSMKGGV